MICPKCSGPIRDLRDVGFNTQAIEAEGICFLWGKDSFTCLAKPIALRATMEEAITEMIGKHAEDVRRQHINLALARYRAKLKGDE